MPGPLKIAAQVALYALFAVAVGYFSASPAYTHFDPSKALIKFSFTHAGGHKGECRRRSAAEIAKLAPNMRRPLDCPRRRLPVVAELVLDGKVLYRKAHPPSGLWGDGPSVAYVRFPVSAGRHVLVARLRDSDRKTGFDYEREAEIDLAPMQNFVVDFRADTGGFIFR